MKDYVKKTVEGFLEKITKTASTPATKNLFKVGHELEAKKLDEKQASAFHHTVAQLLFMCNQAHCDKQTVVMFLTT